MGGFDIIPPELERSSVDRIRALRGQGKRWGVIAEAIILMDEELRWNFAWRHTAIVFLSQESLPEAPHFDLLPDAIRVIRAAPNGSAAIRHLCALTGSPLPPREAPSLWVRVKWRVEAWVTVSGLALLFALLSFIHASA